MSRSEELFAYAEKVEAIEADLEALETARLGLELANVENRVAAEGIANAINEIETAEAELNELLGHYQRV